MSNYLYNGVELPAVPKTEYPYEVIVQNNSSGDYFLMADDEAFTASADGDTVRLFPGVAYALENGEWVESVGRTNCKAIWSNHNILNEDGTLYLAASDPIPVSTFTHDPISLTLGWLVGRRIAGQRGKKIEVPEDDKTPIAYLYNGVQLPKLPEWDRGKYPYATIQSDSGNLNHIYLYVESEYMTIRVIDGAARIGYDKVRDYMYWYYQQISGEWEFQNEHTNMEAIDWWCDATDLIWANHDILNADGSVYLAASDPVPVYES